MSLGLATPLTCYASVCLPVTAWCLELHAFNIDILKSSICIVSKREFVQKHSHSSNFCTIEVLRHIHSLAIMRSLDTHKNADKRVSIKSELLKILSWKNQNEKWTGYQHTWNLYLLYTSACRRSNYPQGQLKFLNRERILHNLCH